MILVIDNYDSFTYNLVQLLGEQGADVRVLRNDAMTAREALALSPTHAILSPGPGYPRDAGMCLEFVSLAAGRIPLLGVCLGHQAICEAFGGAIVHASRLMHGKASEVHVVGGCPLFAGLPPVIEAARYHSLAASRDALPDELLVVGLDEDGEIMAVKHRDHDTYGVQFHPESILTPQGARILGNFLSIGGASAC